MAFSESFFLFELFIEDLKSYITCSNIRIKCQFQDVFKVQLRNPNDLYVESLITKKKNKRKKNKMGVVPGRLVPSSQAAIVVTDVDSLISRMRQYPIELILWSKDNSCALGLSEIPWNPLFIKYLQHPDSKNLPSKSFRDKYVVFDEYTSRRMAIVTLKIKLTHVKNIPQEIMIGLSGAPSDDTTGTMLTTENTGSIKTIYTGGKNNFHKYFRDKNKSKEEKPTTTANKKEKLKQIVTQLKEDTDKDDVSQQFSVIKDTEQVEMSIASLVRSQSDLNSSKLITLRKTKSFSAIDVKERLAKLTNIFGNFNAPLRSQVYWVQYFTVEKENTPTATKSSVKSSPSPSVMKSTISERTGQSPKGYFKFKVCGSQCKIEGVDNNPCFENVCSTDLPEEAARLIKLQKCSNVVECHNKKERGSLLPKHKPIFLKMPETTYETVEKVEGGMEAKMKLGDDPCFCTCECTFGFVKRSTFCKVCGGFEKVGEDIAEITTDPFPCPIYYNLDQKKKKKEEVASPSERSKRKSVKDETEIERGETKKFKKIDDRFKFNYGYKGIRMYLKRDYFSLITKV